MNTVTHAYTHGHTHTRTDSTRTQKHTATNVKHMDNVYNVTVHTQTQTGTRVHTNARAHIRFVTKYTVLAQCFI